MKRRHDVRLAVEALEERWVPATISYNGSTLTISNPTVVSGSTNLQVSQQASGLFQVTDNGRNNGLYNPSNIVIYGSNAPNRITGTLNDSAGHGVLRGSLSITGGNGNDTISVDGTVGTESILGGLSADGSNGNDDVAVGTVIGLQVRGTTQLSGGLGNDTVQLGGGASTTRFAGNLNLHSFQHMPLSTLGTNYTLGAGLRIDEQLNPNTSSTKPFALNVTLPSGATVPGALQVFGGIFNGTVSLRNGTIGSLVTNLGQGNDSVNLTNETVNGNAALTFGPGDSSVTINGGTVINAARRSGGSLALNMGDGGNTYNLGPFIVYGNVTISTPANATTGQNITFAGTVNPSTVGGTDGNLSVNLGNGNNTFTFAGSLPFAGVFSYDAPPPGGHVTSTGNDTVVIDLHAGQLLNVNLFFGYGNDQLDWVGLGAGSAASGSVTGVSGVTTYTDTNNMGAFPVDTRGVNFFFFPPPVPRF
jgi:hypothetical protein